MKWPLVAKLQRICEPERCLRRKDENSAIWWDESRRDRFFWVSILCRFKTGFGTSRKVDNSLSDSDACSSDVFFSNADRWIETPFRGLLFYFILLLWAFLGFWLFRLRIKTASLHGRINKRKFTGKFEFNDCDRRKFNSNIAYFVIAILILLCIISKLRHIKRFIQKVCVDAIFHL